MRYRLKPKMYACTAPSMKRLLKSTTSCNAPPLVLVGTKVILPAIFILAIASLIVTIMHPNTTLPIFAISRTFGAVLSIYMIDCMVTGGCSMGATILAMLAGISLLMDAIGILGLSF